MSQPAAQPTSYGLGDVLGSTEPRLWTPPLVDLTPATSYGFDVVDFADTVLGTSLDPWEQWAVIHAGELLPDGRPRFRVLLILVARQNGKTLVAKVLALYWMFIDQVPMVLGTSTNRDYAKRVWRELCDQAQHNPLLAAELGPDPIRRAIGEEALTTAAGSTYKFAATNRRAGRSLTVHRLLLDEVREHTSFDAWGAATNAMNAVPDGQVIAISNQGDDGAVVLDSLRLPALTYLETGVGDPRLGLFEWSSPAGADPTDLAALAMANPNLGRRVDPDALVGAGMRAKAAGGAELAAHRTEVMCQRVHQLDPAIDPDAWGSAVSADPVDLAQHRDKVALCVDVSLDGLHASLVAAALVPVAGSELVRLNVEVVAAWSGPGCTQALRRELPQQVARIRPRTIGWFPGGPAAAVAADLADRGSRDWPPRRVVVAEITSEACGVCMALAEQVSSGEIQHPDDALLNAQVEQAQRLWQGDRWRYTRKGATPVDAVYALAGAVHLARTLPPAPPPLVVV